MTDAIDLKTRTVVAPVTEWLSRFARGIALDEARSFLFVGCSEGKPLSLISTMTVSLTV